MFYSYKRFNVTRARIISMNPSVSYHDRITAGRPFSHTRVTLSRELAVNLGGESEMFVEPFLKVNGNTE